MSSGGSSNNAGVKEQKRAAAEARRKEAERQARLDYGMQGIEALFNGWDGSKLKSYGSYLPNKYNPKKRKKPRGGGKFGPVPEEYDTAIFSAPGWQDAFLQDYQQAYNDYYTPQLADQYSDAKDELTFALARAGLTRSSAAADEQAGLYQQRLEQEAAVKSQGDQAAAALRQRILSDKQNAINQLYATQDPNIGANAALDSIRTIQTTQPTYSALGDLFQMAQIGTNNIANAQAERRYYNAVTGSKTGGSSYLVGAT